MTPTAPKACPTVPPDPSADCKELPVTPPPVSRLRLLPLPEWDPPYDGETAPPVLGSGRGEGARRPDASAVQGTLALAFSLPSGVPAVPELPAPLAEPGSPPDLHLVAATPAAEETLDEVEFGPQPTPRCALPEPRHWAARFVQAVVEVVGGDRPPSQLVRWTTIEVYDDVTARIVSTGRRGSPTPARPVVRSVHVAEPADGVAEVSALVRRGLRCTAVALRLEGMDGRWQCTALELG